MRYLIPSCLIAVLALVAVHAQDKPTSSPGSEPSVNLEEIAQDARSTAEVISKEDPAERSEAITAYLNVLETYGETRAAGLTTNELAIEAGMLQLKGQLISGENELAKLEPLLKGLGEFDEAASEAAQQVAELRERLKHIRDALPADAAAYKRWEEARAASKR